MIRTSIGKIISVDGEVEKAYKLLDMPKVPAETWAALQNSEASTESTTGADQALVQGSSAGPRNGMGRSATGANNLAQASATRLDGPLDGLIDQVFMPWLYILDELIYQYISDKEIVDILGDELGEEYKQKVNMKEYHEGKVVFEVLAGSSLSAKRTMAQSLTLISQYLGNPQFLEYLADMGYYVDQLTLLDMWMMASEWKDRQDLIKPLTPQMEARRAQKLQQQQQGPMQTQMALNEQKAQLKSAQADQDTAGRIKRDIVRYAVEASARSEATEGQPSGAGFGGSGGFSTLGGSGSLGFRAMRSSAGLATSGLGLSSGGSGGGLASLTSTLGFSGAGGGSAVLGGGALVASLAIGTSLGCGGGLPAVGAAAFLSITSKSTITGSGSISGGRLKKSRLSTAAASTMTWNIADTMAGVRISVLSGERSAIDRFASGFYRRGAGCCCGAGTGVTVPPPPLPSCCACSPRRPSWRKPLSITTPMTSIIFP
jgi:hypothetical protein